MPSAEQASSIEGAISGHAESAFPVVPAPPPKLALPPLLVPAELSLSAPAASLLRPPELRSPPAFSPLVDSESFVPELPHPPNATATEATTLMIAHRSETWTSGISPTEAMTGPITCECVLPILGVKARCSSDGASGVAQLAQLEWGIAR